MVTTSGGCGGWFFQSWQVVVCLFTQGVDTQTHTGDPAKTHTTNTHTVYLDWLTLREQPWCHLHSSHLLVFDLAPPLFVFVYGGWVGLWRVDSTTAVGCMCVCFLLLSYEQGDQRNPRKPPSKPHLVAGSRKRGNKNTPYTCSISWLVFFSNTTNH